jgi:hypothetical protein
VRRASFVHAGLPHQLRAALGDVGDGDAALQSAATALLQAACAARPSLHAGSPAVPCHARVASPGALAAHAARGVGACGDMLTLWSAAPVVPAGALPARPRLLPVRAWAVAGTLCARADGLRLEDANGSGVHVLLSDALPAAALLGRPVLALRWALPPARDSASAVLEVHSLLPLLEEGHGSAARQLPDVGAAAGERVTGAVVAVSPVLRVQAHEFCVAVRRLLLLGRVLLASGDRPRL